MPHFNTTNNIKISDYFNLENPEVKKLFRKLGLFTEEQIKRAIITTIVGDKLTPYFHYEEKRRAYAKAQISFNEFKENYDSKKDHTPKEVQEYNNKKNILDAFKHEADIAKQPIADYVEGYKFNFKKAFDEVRPKNEQEKKEQADMVARFLTLAAYDHDKKILLDKRLDVTMSFDQDLSDEDKAVIENKANELAGKYTKNEQVEVNLEVDINKIKDTYNKNTTFEDKLMFTLVHLSKKEMYEDMRYDEDLDDLNEEEEELFESIPQNFIDSIEINSLEDVKNYINKMAGIKTKLTILAGQEIQNLSNMLEGEDYRENKAIGLYKNDDYYSPAKLLLNQFDQMYNIFRIAMREKIAELHNITEETTFDEVVSILDLDEQRKANYVYFSELDEERTIKVGEIKRNKGLDYIKNDMGSEFFAKLEKEANNAQKELNKNNPTFNLGLKLDIKEADSCLDYQWNTEFGNAFFETSKSANNKKLFNKLSEYSSSDKSYDITKNDNFYNELTTIVPKFNEPAVNLDNPGHLLTKQEITDVILPIRLQEWEKQKQEDPDDEELKNKNVAKLLEDEIDGKVANNKEQAAPDYEWIKNIFKFDTRKSKDALTDKEITEFNSYQKLNIANSAKTNAARLAASIIPSQEQAEAYQLLGLNNVSNSARLAHYYIYVIAKKPGLDLKNLRKTCEDPALKQEYLNFCRENTFANNNLYVGQKAWGEVYVEAARKLKNYEFPDINYLSGNNVEEYVEELNTFRTIAKNASLLADKIFDNDADNAIFIPEKIDVKGAVDFFEHTDYLTRSLDAAWFMIPTIVQKKDTPDFLIENASDRYTSGKRMNLLAGKKLNEITTSISKNEAYINYLTDKQFKFTYSDKLFDTVDTPEFMAANPKIKHFNKMEKTFEMNETSKEDSFSCVMRENMMMFRRMNGEHATFSSENAELAKDLLARNNLEDMKNILNDEYYHVRKDVRFIIDEKFDALFSKEIRDILKVNNIDELDTILVDGISAKDAWGPMYSDVEDPADRKRMIQLEILRSIFKNDKKIEIKNYKINKDLKLTENGTFIVKASAEDVEKLARLSSEYKVINKDFAKTLKDFKKRLVDVLPPVRGESQRKKEARVLVDGTDLYKNMAQSLQNVIDLLENNYSGALEIREAMEELRKNSDIYYNERKGILFGPREGKGTGRLSVSEDMRNAVSEMLMTYDNVMKTSKLDYTIGSSNTDTTTASINDLEREIIHIRSTSGKSLGIKNEFVDTAADFGKKQIKEVNEFSKLQSEIIEFIRKNYKGVIKTNYSLKNVDEIIQPVPGAKAIDKAGYHVYRQIIERVFRNDYTSNDMKYILAEIKTGNVLKEVESLSKKISSINLNDYQSEVISRISDNHDSELQFKRTNELEKNNARKLFDQRQKFVENYNSVTSNVGMGFAKTFMKPEEYTSLCSHITKEAGYNVGRTAATSIALYALALEKNGNRDKYTLEQLINKNQIVDAKKTKFKEILDLMTRAANKANNPNDAAEANKKIAEIIYKGHKKMSQLCDEVANHINFNDEYFDCSMAYGLLVGAGAVQHDVWQESLYCRRQILDLAKIDNPEINTVEKVKTEMFDMINPVSGVANIYGNISTFVNTENLSQNHVQPTALTQGILTSKIIKDIMKDWSKEHQNNNISLSEWAKETKATEKSMHAKKVTLVVLTDVLGDITKKNMAEFKDKIVDESLFSDITYDHDRAKLAHKNYGIKGFPTNADIKNELAYKVNIDQLHFDTLTKLQEYDKGLTNSNTLKNTYINDAKEGFKKISKYIQNNVSLNVYRRAEIEDCVRKIVAEKWFKVFEEKGYKGEDLKDATKNATDYMMRHNSKLDILTNKSSLHKILFTDVLNKQIEKSKEGLFIGEASKAIRRLKNNNYNNKIDELVKDAAYAHTAQILRINGKIPNDADTDRKITCDQYFNTIINSERFKNSLKEDLEQDVYKTPQKILEDSSDDASFKKDIIIQEYSVLQARSEREDREALARVEEENRRRQAREQQNNQQQPINNQPNGNGQQQPVNNQPQVNNQQPKLGH